MLTALADPMRASGRVNDTLKALALAANPPPPPPPPPPEPQYRTEPVFDEMGVQRIDELGMPLFERILIPPPPPPPPPMAPKPPIETLARGTLYLGLFDALSQTMPEEARSAVAPLMAQISPGRRPEGDMLERIDKASLAGARGEVALAIASVLGTRGAGDLAPDAVVRMVRALQTAGINDGARALALESLLLRPVR